MYECVSVWMYECMNDEDEEADEEEEEEEEEEEYNDDHLVILDFRVDGWYTDHDVLKMKYWRGRPYTCRKPMAQGDRGGLNLGLPGAGLTAKFQGFQRCWWLPIPC